MMQTMSVNYKESIHPTNHRQVIPIISYCISWHHSFLPLDFQRNWRSMQAYKSSVFYLKMKISIAFVTLLSLFHFQWLNANSCGLVFKARPFHHLNVTRLAMTFVHHYMDCSFACLQNMLCISFNVAVSANDQGKLRCELLPSTSSNYTANLTTDAQFYLYEIKVSCEMFATGCWSFHIQLICLIIWDKLYCHSFNSTALVYFY